MKRYHEEKHIIGRRLKENRSTSSFNDPKPGRLRKTHLGCNKASCQLCHPEKFPKRIPTKQELQSKKELKEYEQG